jgi:hypothetical protein
VLRKSDWNIFSLLCLLILSHNTNACLGSIDPALGANPSFFSMSDKVNREIYDQNVSADEKFYLFIYNTFPEAPLLPSIRSYNLLLPFSCPPNGTEVVNQNYIHNTWVKAITIMPSVMDEDGNYWALPKGEVLVAYNYSIQLPRSATNVYPNCGIVYTLLNSSAHLSVYANEEHIGDTALTKYETNLMNLTVKADLFASANVRKDYYIPNCYCCKSGKEGCEETCCSCEFSKTEVDEERVRLNSSLSRKVYQFWASPELTMLRCPNSSLGTAAGNLSVLSNVPLQSMFLSFGTANLSLQMHELDIRPILKPHNVLEAQALQHNREFSENMFVSGFNVSSKSIQLNFSGVPQEEVRLPYANFVITDLFGIPHNLTNHTRILCPLTPEIDLIVPHWAEKGSTFQVLVKLSEGGKGLPNKKVTLHYSGEEQAGRTNSQGEVSFALTANQSLIEAKSEYDGKYAEMSTGRNLMVYENSMLSYLLSLLAFLFILVLSYIALGYMTGGGQ